ncbi:hypothetical protein N7450_010643 [Penicillium hetheringtonii]|uniref:Uncharacterized protein n=1 Tax=Penicillium hetheringtonii TaxID=911720 RepID=A0AAD6DA66_9EURO|nr:hypothetical protein N7450_010643 [Penicillium hetheringtonii]
MDLIRKEARQVLQQNPWNRPSSLDSAVSARLNLAGVWADVSSHENSSYLDTCESLYAALSVLQAGYDPELPQDSTKEATAINELGQWAAQLALPSSEFAVNFEEDAEVTDEEKYAQETSRLKSELALELITLVEENIGSNTDDQPMTGSLDLIVAMASFTSEKDPWTTKASNDYAEAYLNIKCQNDLWLIIERLLKEKIRPLFTKTKNPAITSEGRKNLHPMPRTPFEGGALDDSTKPWKNTHIYAPAVLSWIICQYKPVDKANLEAHFLLLVPAMLALIDDSTIAFKIKGCDLLHQILKPIQESGSDILLRTNLVSVFQEAITACLLSLPSITPENSSLKILGAAYPALLALLKATYQPTSKVPTAKADKNMESYITTITKIFRSNLISSFHHISSSTPASATTASAVSFPHLRLSTFLLGWISTFISELGIHSTKYLQDIIPILYTTLSNPFGTAHPPLLFAATSTTKITILNAHPRIWRWRGEILGGLAACWLHVVEEKKSRGSISPSELDELSRALQSTAFAFKHALQNPVPITGRAPDPDQLAAKEEVQSGFKALVDADPELEGLFCPDIADSQS